MSARLACLMGSLLSLAGGCTVKTGFCETSSDCPAGQVCDPRGFRCVEEVTPAGDLAGVDEGPLDMAQALDGDDGDLRRPLEMGAPDLAGKDDLGATFRLSVTLKGQGSVTSNPPGIDCGATCQAVFQRGQKVQLMARAQDPLSAFHTWTMTCSGTAGCEVTLSADTSVAVEFKGRTWTRMTSMTTRTLRGVWGLSASQVWAVGDDATIMYFDGSAWSRQAPPAMVTATLHGVWGKAETEVFAVGNERTILLRDAMGWRKIGSGVTEDLYSIAGRRGESYPTWIAGSTGLVLSRDSADTFRVVESATIKILRGVFVFGASDAWVVGDHGKIIHYSGGQNDQSSGASNLYAVSGTSTRDIWTVGEGGTILHYDGTSWKSSVSPRGEDLRGVWARGPKDVFAVGLGGFIIHYNGTRWEEQPNAEKKTLYGVWGSGGTNPDVFVVGQDGLVLTYGPLR